MHGSKIIGGMIALLAGSLLLLTGWMMHVSGALQGATENGRWALGLAAIAVHLMLAVCGLAMFAARNVMVGLLCGLLMVGAAVCSAWQISVFLATEVISVTRAREQADKRDTARTAAALELAKEQRKTQAELLKEELKWSRGTSREADGRRERKDLAETRAKMIAEAGKIDLPVIPQAKTEAPLRQDGALAQWVAARMGWDETATQASPYLLMALMMLLGEVLLWPLAGYFWNRRAPVIETGPPPREAPAHFLLAKEAEPAALEGATPPKALPAPVLPSAEVGQPDPEPPPARVHPSQIRAPAQQPRQPISETAREALIAAGFPLVRPVEGKPKLDPRRAAERFALWLRAIGQHGEHNATRLAELYRECCETERRDPTSYNSVATQLERLRGVNKRVVRTDDGSPTIWTITEERKFRPGAKSPPIDAHKPETLPHNREALGHLTPSKQAEAIADAAGREAPRVLPFGVGKGPILLRPDCDEPAWLHANRKAMRRFRIETSRRQRGARAGRRAA